MGRIVGWVMSGEDIGYMIVSAIVGTVTLLIVGLISLTILNAFAQAETLQTSMGREILDSAATAIVLIVIIGLPGAGLLIRLMSNLA